MREELFVLCLHLPHLVFRRKTIIANSLIPGSGRCLLERTSRVARCLVLHGQNFHCHFHPGNGSQMVGTGLCQILYQCLVLARFCHCHGKKKYHIKAFELLIFIRARINDVTQFWTIFVPPSPSVTPICPTPYALMSHFVLPLLPWHHLWMVPYLRMGGNYKKIQTRCIKFTNLS